MKYFSLLLTIFFYSCSSPKVKPTDLTQLELLPKFALIDDKVSYNQTSKPTIFVINDFQIIDFLKKSETVWLQKKFKADANEQNFLAQLIPGEFKSKGQERFLIRLRINFKDVANQKLPDERLFPIVTNNNNKNMPMQRIIETVNPVEKFIEQKYVVKTTDKDNYKLFILRLGPDSPKYPIEVYIGEDQTVNSYANKAGCEKSLAYNLRHCVNSQCQVDMSDAYSTTDLPPSPIKFTYDIKVVDKSCHIKITSDVEKTKTCKIPLPFNFLIQDSAFPFRDASFLKVINQLNDQIYLSSNLEEMNLLSTKIKAHWFNTYPLSLMSSREIEFQLPDIDLLMKNYCLETPQTGNPKLMAWKENLQQKIAVKQATLNFKTTSLGKEQKQNAHNNYIQETTEIKKLENDCLINNKIETCMKLAENYVKQNDFLNSAQISAHACKLNNPIACQKAGLSYTQVSDRKTARTYEVKGCELKDSISCYNVACSYCVEGNPTLALKYFNQHIQLGVEDPLHVVFDPTIQCINDTSSFKQIKQKALAP